MLESIGVVCAKKNKNWSTTNLSILLQHREGPYYSEPLVLAGYTDIRDRKCRGMIKEGKKESMAYITKVRLVSPKQINIIA